MPTFHSSVTDLGPFPALFSNEEIKNEAMLFNCDIDFAHKNGGPITRAFIDALPIDWLQDVVVDSRVHMLMPDWTPCIPGWHHDDVPRSGPLNQPNYEDPHYLSEHLMGLVNGDIAPTQFLCGPVTVPPIMPHTSVYEQWSRNINKQLGYVIQDFDVWSAPSGRILQFDWQTFHTGVPATANGWRWFIRVSRKTDRVRNVTNEIRRQAQVYLEFPEKGW